MKLTPTDWRKIWEEFNKILDEDEYTCSECGRHVRNKYDEWIDQRDLIEKVINKYIRKNKS